MRLLLDTHVLLWLRHQPERLSQEAMAAVSNLDNDVYVSAVTAWELAIKQSIGKVTLPGPVQRWLPRALAETGIDELPVTVSDAVRVRALPWHHRDPFGRLLVAQAQAGYVLVTQDRALEKYPIQILGA